MFNPFKYKKSVPGTTNGFEFRLIFSFVIILLPVFVIFLSLEENNKRLIDTNKWVEHTKEILNLSSKINYTIKSVENEKRGYLISGLSSFNKKFKTNVSILRSDLMILKQLTKDNEAQRKQVEVLSGLIEERLSISNQLIETRTLDGFEASKKIFQNRTNILLADRISKVVESIQKVENILLVKRKAENLYVIYIHSNILLTLKVVFIVILMISGFIIVNTLHARRELERQLHELNKSLVHKVNERTKEILDNEIQYKQTLDSMMEGIQIIDKNFRYLYVNDSLAKHGRYPKEELIGHTMMEKYPGIEQSEVFRCIQQCLMVRAPFFLENKFAYPDGTFAWFELSIQAVPEGVFILSIDITERKKVEEELHELTRGLERRVEERTEQLNMKNSELEAFSYSVSHDLRAPLRAMDGYAKILEEDYARNLDDEGKRIINIIVKNARQMGLLIDDLLSFSRLGKQNLVKSEIDLNSFVKPIMDEFIEAHKDRKVKANIKSLNKVQADFSMLKVIMNNLISNAFKYSSKKEATEIEIGSYTENNNVVVYVKDSGAGFNMAYYDKLFGVFQRLHSTAEYPGTGVGLALVQRVVNRHGGRVWATGKENEGATFYFSLPLIN